MGVLRKRGDLNGLPALHAPTGRFQVPSKKIENRCFPRAIHADHTDSFTGSKTPRHMVKNGALAAFWSWEGDGNVLEVQYVFPEARGRHFHQLDAVPGRGNVSDQCFSGGDMELWLGSSRGGTSAQPSQFLRQ